MMRGIWPGLFKNANGMKGRKKKSGELFEVKGDAKGDA